MSQFTLRRERVRSLSAPASITFPAVAVKEPTKAGIKTILKSAMTSQGTRCLINEDTKACTEVGQELRELSGLIERELQGENQTFIEQVRHILTAIRNQDTTIWEPFFKAVENMISKQVCTKTFVNFTAFGIALVRRYNEESPSNSIHWVIDIVTELVSSAYERYHIDEWIQEQGGWRGVLQLVRNKYQSFVDYVPVPRGFELWRQIAVTGGVAIGAIAVGAGVWYLTAN